MTVTVQDPEKCLPTTPRLSIGVPGLDDILGGGLTMHRLYLIEGNPGTGKTTMALQFLLEGARLGETGLYITLSETSDELRAVAASHGWSLDKLSLFELVNEAGLDPDSEQSILHPSEIELGETTGAIMEHVDALAPSRIVFDSLSEMRLLAQNPLRYRRQILALKHFFSTRRCTVLLLDDKTSEPGDQQLHSIVHGVISLDQTVEEVGAERRKLRVIKMRGIKFRGGFHDFMLDTGGIRVFPRLVASEHHKDFSPAYRSTGSPGLDALLGGGLVPGTNTLLSGPSGVGKTTTAMRCALTALERGERVAIYMFDEGVGTMLARASALGMELRPYIENGALNILQVDPAEMSPGEFSSLIRTAVETNGISMLVIDSLNGYMQAMPGEKFLLLQMHEMVSFLRQQGVTALLILGQHGLIGDIRSDIDLSYLSDANINFRYFEAQGRILTAISATKSRTTNHERTIRQFRLGPAGVEVGEAIQDFEGILAGLPAYRGAMPMMGSHEE